MGYFVEFATPVLDYLECVEGLTNDDRAQIMAGIIEELTRDAAKFLALRPLAYESFCFRYDYPHMTEDAMYNFDFVVDSAFMEMGVVRVVYVECGVEPISRPSGS